MNSSSFINKFSMLGLIFAACIRTSVCKCNVFLRIELIAKCEIKYNGIAGSAQDMDHKDREETFCCALENLETCVITAYDTSHCQDEKQSLERSLKAAKQFFRDFNVSCNEFKKQCSSCSTVFLPPWGIGLLALLLTTKIYT